MSLIENKLTLTEVLKSRDTDRQSRLERLKQLEELRKNAETRRQQIVTPEDLGDVSERPARKTVRPTITRIPRTERVSKVIDTRAAENGQGADNFISGDRNGFRESVDNVISDKDATVQGSTQAVSSTPNISNPKVETGLVGSATHTGARQKTFVPKPFSVNDSQAVPVSLEPKVIEKVPEVSENVSLQDDADHHDNKEVEDSYEEEDLDEFKSKLLGSSHSLPSSGTRHNGMPLAPSFDTFSMGLNKPTFGQVNHSNRNKTEEITSLFIANNGTDRQGVHSDFGQSKFQSGLFETPLTSQRSTDVTTGSDFLTRRSERDPVRDFFTRRTEREPLSSTRNTTDLFTSDQVKRDCPPTGYSPDFSKHNTDHGYTYDVKSTQDPVPVRDRLRGRQWNTFHYSNNTNVVDCVKQDTQSKLDEIFNRRNKRLEESKKYLDNLRTYQTQVPVISAPASFLDPIPSDNNFDAFDRESFGVNVNYSTPPSHTPKTRSYSSVGTYETPSRYRTQLSHDYGRSLTLGGDNRDRDHNTYTSKETDIHGDLVGESIHTSYTENSVDVGNSGDIEIQNEFATNVCDDGEIVEREEEKCNGNNEVLREGDADDSEIPLERDDNDNDDDSDDSYHEDITVIEPKSPAWDEEQIVSSSPGDAGDHGQNGPSIVNRMLYGSPPQKTFIPESLPEKSGTSHKVQDNTQTEISKGCCDTSTQTEPVSIVTNSVLCDQGIQATPISHDFCVQARMTDRHRESSSGDKILIGRIRKRSLKSGMSEPVTKKQGMSEGGDSAHINGTKQNGLNSSACLSSANSQDKDSVHPSAFTSISSKPDPPRTPKPEPRRKSLTRSRTLPNTPARPKSAQGMEGDRDLCVVSPTPSLRSLTSTPPSARKERRKSKSLDKKIDKDTKKKHASNDSGLNTLSSFGADVPSFARPTLSNLQKTRKSTPSRKSQPSLQDALFSPVTPTKDLVSGEETRSKCSEEKEDMKSSDATIEAEDEVFSTHSQEKSSPPEPKSVPAVPSNSPPANIICPTPSYGSVQNVTMDTTKEDDKQQKQRQDSSVIVDKIIHKAAMLEQTLNRVCSPDVKETSQADIIQGTESNKGVNRSPRKPNLGSASGAKSSVQNVQQSRNGSGATTVSKSPRFRRKEEESNVKAKSPTPFKRSDSNRKQVELSRPLAPSSSRMNKSKLTSSFPKLSPTRLSKPRPLEHCLSDEELREPLAPYQPTFANQEEVPSVSTAQQKNNGMNGESDTQEKSRTIVKSGSENGTNEHGDCVVKKTNSNESSSSSQNLTTSSQMTSEPVNLPSSGVNKSKHEKKKKGGHKISLSLFKGKKSK